MITYRKGDIIVADVEALVNTVNCVGIMGRGIALQFKKAFPQNFKEYEVACKRGEVEPGRMFVHRTGHITNPRYIINFPTKRHWKGNSRLEDIEAGLIDLVKVIKELGIRSIAVPPLGCGLGGLDWNEVRPRIEAALQEVPEVEAIVFEPAGAPAPEVIAKSVKVPHMTPARATLLGLMHRYLLGLMDPFVTLLEIHKLMYFMQEAKEPLRLKFKKAYEGPYAENLRHVLIPIDGYYISGYAEGGDAPDKQISLVPGAVKDAEAFLSEHLETMARFDRVADLVQGFETPFGLELLSSVHWVATRENANTPDQAQRMTYAWNERKRRFAPNQIDLAWDILQSKNWLTESEAASSR